MQDCPFPCPRTLKAGLSDNGRSVLPEDELVSSRVFYAGERPDSPDDMSVCDGQVSARTLREGRVPMFGR